ncbi:MAG: hypothetical protein HZB30_10560 [Nitrospirae bacterium]|nr:hypothetical protein [Nitrospirota bacterium]
MDKLIGIGFYQKDQWPLLLETADDIDMMEKVYEKWLKGITRLISNMRAEGIEPVTVNIDIYELLAYCSENNLKNIGETRSQFVAEILRNGRSGKIENDLFENNLTLKDYDYLQHL